MNQHGRTIIRISLLAVTMACASVSAFAQTEEQTNVINHIGDALTIDIRCPTLKLNEVRAALISATYDVQMSNPTHRKLLDDRMTEQKKVLAALDADSICLMGSVMFGPSGGNVPSLLVEE